MSILLGAVTTVGVAWGAVWRGSEWSRAVAAGIVDVPRRGPRPAVLPVDCLFASEKRSSVTTWRKVSHGLQAAATHGRVVARGDVPDLKAMLERLASSREAATWRELPLARHMISGWGRLPADDCTTEAEANGWPARALWSVAESDDTWPGPLTWRRDGALGVSADLSMPTFIVWRGFVFDTFFYAVPWWIVLITPGAVERWRRKRRGACLACGYDLRALGDGATCPECGQAARTAAGRRPALSDDC